MAKAEGWPCVPMTDQPQQLNVASAVQTMLAALADRDILPMEPVK